jgi:hypothetical protein
MSLRERVGERFGLWVPGSAKPTHFCRICQDEFYSVDELAAHVVKCASEHHDELREQLDTARPPGFFEPFDPEYYKHIREGGKPG